MYMAANEFVRKHHANLEMIGVIMRIISFSLVSWMGANSPFMFVWIFNTCDAILLTWCSAVVRNSAYLLLNSFWILVGVIGIARAGGWLQ